MMSYWLDQTFSRQRNNIRTLKFVDSSACLNAYTLLRNKNMGFKQIYLRYIPKGWQPLKNKPLANSRWQNTKWKQLCVMMEGFVICTGHYHINSNSAVSNIVKLLCTRNTKIYLNFFFWPISPLIITPLWWGSYPIRVSSHLGLGNLRATLFSVGVFSQSYPRLRELCFIGLHSRLIWSCHKEGPIYLGYIPFGSVPFFEVVRFHINIFWEFKVVHFKVATPRKNHGTWRGSNCSSEAKSYYKAEALPLS